MSKISVDAFLSEHARTAFLGTIEATTDNDRVKVTPWLPQVGCLCFASLDVPKSVIASVTPTGETAYCCGKTLQVLEIEFAETANVLQDIFGQLLARESAAPQAKRFAAANQIDCQDCNDFLSECLAGCHSPSCKSGCINAYRRCRANCIGID